MAPVTAPRVSSSFAGLLSAARAGSREALGILLDTASPYLLRIAGGRLGQRLRARVDPADLVQDTFLEAQRDLPRFQGATWPRFLGWLRCILLHNLNDVARRHTTARRELGRESRQVCLGEAAALPTRERPVVERLLVQEQLGRVKAAFARLSRDHRRVLALRLEGRFSFAEIGDRILRTPEATRKLWRRAVTRLRCELNRATA